MKYFNVLDSVTIKGTPYDPKKSYRVTQENFTAIRDLVDERKAVFTDHEVNFGIIDASPKAKIDTVESKGEL